MLFLSNHTPALPFYKSHHYFPLWSKRVNSCFLSRSNHVVRAKSFSSSTAANRPRIIVWCKKPAETMPSSPYVSKNPSLHCLGNSIGVYTCCKSLLCGPRAIRPIFCEELLGICWHYSTATGIPIWCNLLLPLGANKTPSTPRSLFYF